MPGRADCRLPALLSALLLTAGCGYIDPPLVPLANVPDPVVDLAAVQRGAVLIVHATVPTFTTENVRIRTPLTLELHIGTPGDHFNAEEWAGRARKISDAQFKNGLATYEIPIKDWTGKQVVIGVRAIGPNGKESNWSNYANLRVVPPPEVPSPPKLENVAAGVHVTWTGGGDQFRVLRRAANEETYVVAMTLPGHEWTDTGTEYGKTYTYMMQALVDAGDKQMAESDFSATWAIVPKDEFAPAVPSGLSADPTPGSIALNWLPDTEPDLAGYRIYRSVDDGPWQKVADQNTVPSYNDTAVEHGKTYHYAVSAVDKAGNESARCSPVVVVP